MIDLVLYLKIDMGKKEFQYLRKYLFNTFKI